MCADRAIRMNDNCRAIELVEFYVTEDIIIIGFTMKDGQPLSHAMGQNIFLTVPAISLLEAHPFSICSAPGDRITKLMVKATGDASSFTRKLHNLAADKSTHYRTLSLNIEGPYGIQPEFSDYDCILFIAGGIGITPCHSCVRGLHSLATSQVSHLAPSKVRLLWNAKSEMIFDLFAPTWESIQVTSDHLFVRFMFPLRSTKFKYAYEI